jgi:hypothetical protein
MKRGIFFILVFFMACGYLFCETKITDTLDFTFYMEHVKDEGLYRIISTNAFAAASEKIELDWSSDGNLEIITLVDTDPQVLINAGTFLDSGYLFYPSKLYVLAGAERRESLALDYRVEGGIGGKYYFMKNDTVNWSVSCIPLVLWEKYVDNEVYLNGRLSFRHKLELFSPGKVVTFSSVVFYQPLFTDMAGSFIIDADASVTIKTAKHIAMVVKYMYDLDKNETLDVPKDTWKSVLSAGIILSF